MEEFAQKSDIISYILQGYPGYNLYIVYGALKAEAGERLTRPVDNPTQLLFCTESSSQEIGT